MTDEDLAKIEAQAAKMSPDTRAVVLALVADLRAAREFVREPLIDQESFCIICGQDFGHRPDCRWVAMVSAWGPTPRTG